MALTDVRAFGPPIYVEGFLRGRDYTNAVGGAGNAPRFPVDAGEEVWNQLALITSAAPDPALVPNGGPLGLVPVELIAMQLQLVAGSAQQYERGPAGPPPPAGSLSRVIPP